MFDFEDAEDAVDPSYHVSMFEERYDKTKERKDTDRLSKVQYSKSIQ